MKSSAVAASLALAFLAFALVPSSATAFDLSAIGVRAGEMDPEGAGGAFTVGGHLEFEQSGTRLHLQPGVLFWSSGSLSDVNPNFDVMYHFQRAGTVSPYVGGGAGLHFYSLDLPGPNETNTDIGLNLLGGLLIPASTLRLFVEGRYVATDRSQAMIAGGATFPLGHQ